MRYADLGSRRCGAMEVKVQEFWVVGGEFTDTRFATPAPAANHVRLGPFATYEDAYKAWAGRTWATVDSATTRFRIVDRNGVAVDSEPKAY